jgi:predicted nucleic acid-binding protein
MARRTITLNKYSEKVLASVRKEHKLTTLSEAIDLVIEMYGPELLGLEFKPSFIKKMKRIEKEHLQGKAKRYTSFEDFRRDIEQK